VCKSARKLRTLGNAVRIVVIGPVWLAQLFTGAKSFADNPILGCPAFNRRGLHAARVSVAHWFARARRGRLSHLISQGAREAFDRQGFVARPGFLRTAEFDQMVAEVKRFRGAGRETVQGDAITRRIALNPAALRRMPSLKKLVASAEFQGLIRYAGSFDAEPMLYLQTVLTKARIGAPDPQLTLHADAFHPTVKAWLFLTDVKADAAAFTFVPGSHRLTPERLAWEHRMSIGASRSSDPLTRRGSFRIDPGELNSLNLPQPMAFDVSANTLVVADTFGFHARGPSTTPSFRVEVWAYGRHNPFMLWPRLFLWNIPVLRRWQADLFWTLGDLAEAIGLRRNVWRACRKVSAFDGEPPCGPPDPELRI